ncbi:uroporphyrinogen-III synthase [Pseudorhodoferax sp.]|uniref:uroporphyrinogen-III synthase n=1 Tax=Pseudorhodoferax sp. TaxID=1993553 RepID=UPI0039E5E802
MRVLVTRPLREALSWCAQLCAHGVPAEPLPLIEIAPVDPAPLRQAWEELPACRAAMFVSANAVDALFSARPGAMPWPAATRAWATGPGTVRALRAAGVPQAGIDAPDDGAAQFDSEALWQRVGVHAMPAGTRVLIVRGADAEGRLGGRPWLAEQLAARGVALRQLVAYQRRLPPWDAAARAGASAAGDGGLWLFSSSDAVRHLQRLLPGQSWARAAALATHARIAEAARGAGFGRVAVTQPTLAAVLASIESPR